MKCVTPSYKDVQLTTVNWLILQLTDFRGEPYPYDHDATWPDEYGVLATADECDHEKYLKIFPADIKDQIKDYYKKK